MAFPVQDRSQLSGTRNANRAPWSSLLVLGCTCALFVATAHATPGVTVDQYRAPGSSQDGFATARPDTGKHLQLEARLGLDYAHDPLVYETRRNSSQSERVSLVSDQLAAQLGVSLGVIERLLFFASLPVNLVMEGTPLGMQPTATGFGAGDFGAGVRALVLRGEPGALGIELNATLPTGEDGHGTPAVAGNAGAVFTPAMLGELAFGAVRVTANVGVRFRKTVSLPGGTRFANELAYALALSVPLGTEALRGQAELFGSTLTSDAGLRASSPLEALLGLKLSASDAVTLGLAGGLGLLRGYGAPDLRIIAQLAWHTEVAPRDEPNETAPAPIPPPAIEAPPPAAAPPEPAPTVIDFDHDDIPDEDDACPPLAGPREWSGCPEHVSYARASGLLMLEPVPNFSRSSGKLAPRSLAAVESLARALRAGPQQRVIIEIHLEPKTKVDLAELSQERARALAAWLVERGVVATSIEAYGCAASRPLGTNKHDRALSERVEIYLVQPLPELGMPSTLNCAAVSAVPVTDAK